MGTGSKDVQQGGQTLLAACAQSLEVAGGAQRVMVAGGSEFEMGGEGNGVKGRLGGGDRLGHHHLLREGLHELEDEAPGRLGLLQIRRESAAAVNEANR